MKAKISLTACLIAVTTILSAQSFEWVKTFQGNGNAGGQTNSIKIDDLGNVYTVGVFSGTVDFDPGPGTYNLTATVGSHVFVQKMNSSGNFIWAKSFYRGTGYTAGLSMGLDALGNVYTSGSFSGTIDFDPGTETTGLSSVNSRDYFVQKMDSDGNFIWARSFGSAPSNNYPQNYIDVDVEGNVYSAGMFAGTADFDPGEGTSILTSAGATDVFVQKMDTDGNFVWACRYGGTSTDHIASMSIDNDGNIYTTGYFFGTVDFDPGMATYNLTGGGSINAFVSKLTTDGSFDWAFNVGGTSSADGFSIHCDNNGNVYTFMYVEGAVDFDPGPATTILGTNGLGAVYLQKLDPSGSFLWAKPFVGGNNNYVSIDDSENIYCTGAFFGTIDFDPGPGTAIVNMTNDPDADEYNFDSFVHKTDEAANYQWVRTFNGNTVGMAITLSIDVDNSGNIYTTGYFTGTVDFDPGVGTFLATNTGSNSGIFIHKMSQGTEVTGYVFIDTNENGIMDAGETPVPNQSISYYNASDVAVTSESGFFRAFPPAGSQEFNFELPQYYTNTTPASQTINVQTGITDTLYFGIHPITDVNDLVAEIFPFTSPRPGFTRNYLLSYQNTGTTTLDNVTLKFLKTTEDDLVLASGAYTVSNDTLIWNLGTLEPYATGSFNITHTLSVSAVLGDLTHTQAWIIPISGDATPLNNAITLDELIVGSYDPNDKKVSPEVSAPTENEPLEYTIRFQNTGNYQADFVIVKDTLDAQLDLSTFQMIAASHSYEVEIINRIATWTFNEINLPDSTSDEAGSHGFIKFKVQRIDGLGVGTQIPNSAAIYFDYNEPVITNTCIYSIENCMSASTDVQSACNSYTWIDGNTYTSSNNTATYIIDNAAGCDSIITLNLTITNVSNIGTTISGATITANNNNGTYQWLDCDDNNAPIVGATSQTFTATEDGNYAVSITENGCTNTSACVAVTIIGIDESNNALQANVYPNPSQGQVEITLGKTTTDVELVLTDVQGKVVFKRNYPSLFKTNIELPDAKGVYFLKINAQGSTETIRLVRE